MRFRDITEADVTDIGAFRHKKHEQQISDTNKQIQQAKERQFNDIDHVVAATIDRLSQIAGKEHAKSIVYQHLSDLVMGYEYEGGKFD